MANSDRMVAVLSEIKSLIAEAEVALSKEQLEKRLEREGQVLYQEPFGIDDFILENRCAEMLWFCIRYSPLFSGYATSYSMLKLMVFKDAVKRLISLLHSSGAEDRAIDTVYTWFLRKKKECLVAANAVSHAPRRRRRRRAGDTSSARASLVDGSQYIPFSGADMTAPSLGAPHHLVQRHEISKYITRDLDTSKHERELQQHKWWILTEEKREEKKKAEAIVGLLFEVPGAERNDAEGSLDQPSGPPIDIEPSVPSPQPSPQPSEFANIENKDVDTADSLACTRMDKWLDTTRSEWQSKELVLKKSQQEFVHDSRSQGKLVPAAKLYRVAKESRSGPRRVWNETLAIGAESGVAKNAVSNNDNEKS